MSLGPYDLKRKIDQGNKQAEKVYSVRKNGNQLLVTLLLGNVAVNSVLSVFLGSITTGIMAVVVATALITLFGEIIPQAVLSRYALKIGAKTVWIVKIFMFVLYPICRPIAWVLDRLLGQELPTIYSKKELVSLLEEHSNDVTSDVKAHEEKIARGALTYGEKIVHDVMTPRSVVTFLDANDVINRPLVDTLKKSGHARYPVYKNTIDNMVGMLYYRDLIDTNKERVGMLMRRPVYFIREDQTLDQALSAFLKNKHHLSVVINSFEEVIGVLSLEDVLEEILGAEIVDEFDHYDDMRAVAKLHNR